MADQAGWFLFVEHEGKMRVFTIAENDLKAARKAVLGKVESGTVLGWHEVEPAVIEKMNMLPGEIKEWHGINAQRP